MTSYRTALPAAPLAGSIAALQLRHHASRHGYPPSIEAQALTQLLIDRVVELGGIRPELGIAIAEHLHVEIRDEGHGVRRITTGHEAPDLIARLDRQAINWGHHQDDQGTRATLWFDFPHVP